MELAKKTFIEECALTNEQGRQMREALERYQCQHRAMDKWLENLHQWADEGAQQTHQLKKVAGIHEREITSDDQRIGKVETTSLALLRDNEAMRPQMLTLSKEINTNRAARNHHSQYQFLTVDEQLTSSVLTIYQQVTSCMSILRSLLPME